MKNSRLLTILGALLAFMGLISFLASPAKAAELSNQVPDRTQIFIVNADGSTQATTSAEESQPALSLAKLYLGYYVVGNGDAEDVALVGDMIRYSQDATADYLESIYPQAIPEVIDAFGLSNTEWAGFWGNSTTSAKDIATFVSAIRNDPIGLPLIQAMQSTATTASDGYEQNFGTSTLSGVTGTKFGWSDNLDVHSSVSIAPGFVIAAITYGSAEQHTADVQATVTGTNSVPEASLSQVLPHVASPKNNPLVPLKELVHCSVLAPLEQAVPRNVMVPHLITRLLPTCK